MAKGLIKSLRKKDVKTISKLISNIENKDDGYLDSLSDIHSYIGNAYRIGITGPPGSGKSSIAKKVVSENFLRKCIRKLFCRIPLKRVLTLQLTNSHLLDFM